MTKMLKELHHFIESDVELARQCLDSESSMNFSGFERSLLESAITYNYSPQLAIEALAGNAGALISLLRAQRIISVMTGRTDVHIEYARPIVKREAVAAAGVKSGCARRAWQADAIHLAQDICDSSAKNLTQRQLAEKIRAHWVAKGLKPYVDVEGLVKRIREWEKSGQLQKRRKT